MKTQKTTPSTTAPKPLSETMEAALAFARLHHNSLRRAPGGFWADGTPPMPHSTWFGTQTVEALIERGLLEYCEHAKDRYGKLFPVVARVVGTGAPATAKSVGLEAL